MLYILYSTLYKGGVSLTTQPILLNYLKIVENLSNKYADSHLKTIDLTKSQADIIFFLAYQENHKMNQRDIERGLSLSNPTVSGLLKRLETKGFIKRMSDPNDSRSRIIQLTPEVYEIMDNIYENISRIEKKLLEGFTEQEKIIINSLLKRVADNAVQNM